MKIIAGQARGREIRSLAYGSHVRPILARIKKSVFDIIKPRMVGCTFLDLYAGTGSVGLEALSRGANSAVFIEQDSACARTIQENLELLRFADRGRVMRLSATGNLASLPGPFNIIFMGPPYKDREKNMLQLTVPTLSNIDKFNLLADGGLIVCQHHKKEPVLLEAPSPFTLKRQEKYGDTLVSFFERTQK